MGYAGRNRDEFLTLLKGAGVVSLVDIRANPVSMYKPDFSKGNLKRLLEENGINYYHQGSLGVPRAIRAQAVGQPDRKVIWDWYDANVVQRVAGRNLHWFFNALEHPVALMCTELDPTSCHRHRLALGLEGRRLQGFDL
ncbi:MAG: DUF488 domain-containing protein [Chloroflexota bacterium]